MSRCYLYNKTRVLSFHKLILYVDLSKKKHKNKRQSKNLKIKKDTAPEKQPIEESEKDLSIGNMLLLLDKKFLH